MNTRKKNRQQSVCCHLRKLIVSCAVLLMGLMAFAGLDDGLVVHYSMDALDASGKVPDLSGNGRDLTLFGDAALQDSGLKGGKALFFNGVNGAAFDDGRPTDGTLSAKWVVTSDETGAATITDDSLTGGVFVGGKVGKCRLAVEVSDGFFTTRSEPVDVEVEKSGFTILVR